MNISKLLSTRVRNIKINPFLEDLTAQKNFLHSQINDKKILVIGGVRNRSCQEIDWGNANPPGK